MYVLPSSTSHATPPASTSPPMDDVSECIQFVERAAENYVASEDQVVELRVNGQTFRVSKVRLTHRSPVFREMFNLAPACGAIAVQKSNGNIISKVEYTDGTEKMTVDLHNDPEEFRHFLWYLHADPLSAHRFSLAMPTAHKCYIMLGIASVAHMYEALDVAEWALGMALQMHMIRPKYRFFSLDLALAVRLLQIAGRFQEASNTIFLSDARDVVCDALHPDCPGPLSVDPIAVMLVLEDTYVLGHAYFYVLLKGKDYWLDDTRLTASHRQRLICGGFSLAQTPRPPVQSAAHISGEFGFYRRPLPTPATMTSSYLPGTGARLPSPPPQTMPVWKPLVHLDIEDKRDELWALFDNERWQLTD